MAKRILLLKAYQPIEDHIDCPPLGLLYLVTALRRRFGDSVQIACRDLKLERCGPQWLAHQLDEFAPDVVGVSAINNEAHAAHGIAEVVKAWRPSALVALGGPYAHKRGAEILGSSRFDWTFNGEAERSFPEALDRWFRGHALGADIPGLCYRDGDRLHVSDAQDSIRDLDALGFPAWDLVDFDRYARTVNRRSMHRGRRYATLFTSRGCPFRCSYCHDVFGKRFVARSAAHVLDEIELLHTRYGVDEFDIEDDVFNFDKPRVLEIMSEVKRRWPGEVHFHFSNGLRADILDEEMVEALRQGGTYGLALAIETVSPRLQRLVGKRLNLERAKKAIEYCDERGIATCGFFMLGFPTETVEELQATVDFAVKSRLTLVLFNAVIPQPATPLYELARAENAEAVRGIERDVRLGQGYRADRAWYQRAYGFDLGRFVQLAYARFYLAPRRVWRIVTRVPTRNLAWGLGALARYVLRIRPETGRRAAVSAAGWEPEEELARQ